MRIALLIQYDGSAYHGWQVQKDVSTVQGRLETALAQIYDRQIGIMGSGRTDAGVHALGQVAHFDVDVSPIPPEKIWMLLNRSLPRDIRVLASAQVDDAFHARFLAMERRYQYHVVLAPNVLVRNTAWATRFSPDHSLLEAAAALLPGTHDFSSFCYAGTETENMICQVAHAQWTPIESNGYRFTIHANRFLHHMVRMLVGTMMEVGRGKWSIETFKHRLEQPDRQAHVVTAPPQGLVLENVIYPPQHMPDWSASQTQKMNAKSE